MTRRHGITIPLPGAALPAHRDLLRHAADLGFTDVWSSETSGHDAFTPLALTAAWEPRLRLGTAIVPASTRGPAVLAQTVAAMCEAAPGRVALGVGASSNVIVQRWNSQPFESPYQRVRDVVTFLRATLAGEKVTQAYETFEVSGFRLEHPPVEPPPILLAALRPAMLRLAGEIGDGAILNFLSPDDVRRVLRHVGAGKEIVARLFVVPSEDPAVIRAVAGPMITAYLTVPVYRAFHEWLGRGPLLEPMWDAWERGDRRSALELVPDEVITDLFVTGGADAVHNRLRAYSDAGVTTPAPQVLGDLIGPEEVLALLAPRP